MVFVKLFCQKSIWKMKSHEISFFLLNARFFSHTIFKNISAYSIKYAQKNLLQASKMKINSALRTVFAKKRKRK